MDTEAVAKINRAVDECLDFCLRSSTPGHISLEGYCHELRQHPDWSGEEIEKVRSIVLRLLSART